MPVAEQLREAKQFLKDLPQNLSALALSALTPLFAVTLPSLLSALWGFGRCLCLELLWGPACCSTGHSGDSAGASTASSGGGC